MQKHIKWGQNYSINKIKYSLFKTKVENIVYSIIRIIKKAIIAGITVGECFFSYFYVKDRLSSRDLPRENVIIIGGELFNKGAQAMTFTVVDQMKKRFPDKNIYLFSTKDFNRIDVEKSGYTFKILPWELTIKLRLLSFWNKLLMKNSTYSHLENNVESVIKNGDFIIDISGYALSSQWHWFGSFNYLLNIILAKKYSVQYYIFPQSIGPFNYPLKYKILLYTLMKLYLKYPKRIFPREKEGLAWVRKFTKNNVEQNHDIVLQTEQYNLSSIYNKKICPKDIKIMSHSIAIIPNLRVFDRAKSDEMYLVYVSLIDRLINANKTVYLLRHSYEDLEICKKIKNNYLDNNCVQLIPDDLNAFELENILKQFDFVIASRYHSIIHSYKNGVPALVIGWATKYFELLDDFNQSDYCFDVRDGININEINDKLDKMIREYTYEKDIIINKMKLIKEDSIFDIL